MSLSIITLIHPFPEFLSSFIEFLPPHLRGHSDRELRNMSFTEINVTQF